MAGPIERAINLLPQFDKQRILKYDQVADGFRQILWGLFKKIVIADNIAIYVDYIFENSATLNGSTLLLGGIFFAIQAYCDFSAYSDIAIGAARILGFELKQNFAFPFFSRSTAELWQRWHISLMAWFREYVYFPLGGGRVPTWKKYRNIFVVFLLSGLWHGANWTFIVWGCFNAFLICSYQLLNLPRTPKDVVAVNQLFPSIADSFRILRTFLLFALSVIFFRATNIQHALDIFLEIGTSSLFERPTLNRALPTAAPILIMALLMIIIEWIGRRGKHGLETFVLSYPRVLRYAFYYLLIFAIFWFKNKQQAFIYFQF